MALNFLHVFESYQSFPHIFQELTNKQKKCLYLTISGCSEITDRSLAVFPLKAIVFQQLLEAASESTVFFQYLKDINNNNNKTNLEHHLPLF